MILFILALLQAKPPTVGDTVWVGRTVRVRAGAVVRVTPWPEEPEAVVQPLGPPVMTRRGDSMEIRYPLVAWTIGEHPLEIPGPVLLGPGAAVDSLPDEATTLVIESVLPDSVDPDSAPVQPAAREVRGTETSSGPPLEFLILGIALALLILRTGRRRPPEERPAPALAPPAPDVMRWAGAGELRTAQAAALARLRETIQRLVPGARTRLSIDEVLTELRRTRGEWPLLEIEGLLVALDGERFAPERGDPDLVERADSLRVRLERGG